MGDISLLAGSPSDAFDHYVTATDLSQTSNDWVWRAAALEGTAQARVRRDRMVLLHRADALLPVVTDRKLRVLRASVATDEPEHFVAPALLDCAWQAVVLEAGYIYEALSEGHHRLSGI